MVSNPYEQGDDVEDYVGAALSRFEKDRASYFGSGEVTFVNGEDGSESDAVVAFDLDTDPPTLDQLSEGRPAAVFYFALLMSNLLLSAAKRLTNPYASDPDLDETISWPLLASWITSHEELGGEVQKAVQLAIAQVDPMRRVDYMGYSPSWGNLKTDISLVRDSDV